MLLRLWDVAAQVQSIAEPHHDRAARRAANPIEVVADGFHCSVALDGIGQMQGLGHGITIEVSAVLRIRPWTRLRYLIRLWLSLCLSASLHD